MDEIEEKAKAEAEKKGLDREEEERYVGGTFNRIRQRKNGYASPHKKRVSRREEREEESRHWKKYHQHDDSEMNHRIRDAYADLSPRGRTQAQAHFRREGLTTNYSKQSRRDKEKMLDYLESQKSKPGMTRTVTRHDASEDQVGPRHQKLKGTKASFLQK